MRLIDYLQNSRFVRQAIRKGLELNSSPSNPNRKLFVKELSRNQQIPISRFRAKLHHIPQTHPCLLHTTPSMNLLDQPLGKRLASLLSRHVSALKLLGNEFEFERRQQSACETDIDCSINEARRELMDESPNWPSNIEE